MIGTAQQTLHQRQANVASWNVWMKKDDPNFLTADDLLESFMSGKALEELRQMFIDIWEKVNVDDIKDIFDKGLEFAELGKDAIKDHYDKFLSHFAAEMAAVKSRTQAARFRIDKVRDEINEGISKRETIPEIAERIGGYFEPMEQRYLDPLTGKERTWVGHTTSMTIASTEIHSAIQFGEQETGKASGMVVKQWMHSGKLSGRPDHIMLDGFLVPIDKPYEFTDSNGSLISLMYPGDPSSPHPEHIINCGCASTPMFSTDEVVDPMSAEEKRQRIDESFAAQKPRRRIEDPRTGRERDETDDERFARVQSQVAEQTDQLMSPHVIEGLRELSENIGEIT